MADLLAADLRRVIDLEPLSFSGGFLAGQRENGFFNPPPVEKVGTYFPGIKRAAWVLGFNLARELTERRQFHASLKDVAHTTCDDCDCAVCDSLRKSRQGYDPATSGEKPASATSGVSSDSLPGSADRLNSESAS